MMWEIFGIKPKEKIYEYQQSYSEWFDKVPTSIPTQDSRLFKIFRARQYN